MKATVFCQARVRLCVARVEVGAPDQARSTLVKAGWHTWQAGHGTIDVCPACWELLRELKRQRRAGEGPYRTAGEPRDTRPPATAIPGPGRRTSR